MKIWQKIILGFGVAILMLAAIAVVTYRSTSALSETSRGEGHSRQVLEARESLLRRLIEAENGARGYLLAADEQYLATYETAQKALVGDFTGLKALTADNPSQQTKLKALRPLITQKLTTLKAAMTARRESGLEAAIATLGNNEDRRVTGELRQLLRSFGGEEKKLLSARTASADQIERSARVIIMAAAVISVLFLSVAVVLILRDIAARQRAEEALAEEHNLLRSVIDAMPQHVFVKDLAGRYLIDNAAHRRFVGVDQVGGVEGKIAQDFFPADIAQLFEEDDREVLTKGTEILNREELVLNREGEMVWLATTKVPLWDTERKCAGLVCVSRDISESKKGEERLRLTADQLKRSNHELQEFASVASHDLQEPLRKIQAFGDRLRMKCGAAVGEEGRDYLDRMQNAARRMQILLHDLLTLSRVTIRAKPFERVNLHEVIREVVGDLEVRIEQTGAQIEIGYLPIIDADAAQMRQLFQNLLSNAMKFQAPQTAPEVAISSKILDVSEDHFPGVYSGDTVCQIMVKDNGIGFDEKYLDRIFTVFQRLHSRSEYEGTGIGLAVCRKILDRHGGVISAKSAEGQGATFIVTLPVKQRMRNDDEIARRTDHNPNG